VSVLQAFCLLWIDGGLLLSESVVVGTVGVGIRIGVGIANIGIGVCIESFPETQKPSTQICAGCHKNAPTFESQFLHFGIRNLRNGISSKLFELRNKYNSSSLLLIGAVFLADG